LIYAQHLSGVGHLIRSVQIARELARAHTVELFDGGSSVPLPIPSARSGAGRPRLRKLAPIGRRGGRLVSLNPNVSFEAATVERMRALRNAVIDCKPDVLMIEHYPFSKWELQDEVRCLISTVRAARSSAKIICSVRDIAPQTRHERVDKAIYAARVLTSLHADFDAVLVHSDPELSTLADYFPAAGQLRIPVHHTGIVCQALWTDPIVAEQINRIRDTGPYLLASIGGGADPVGLLNTMAQAWPGLSRGPLRGWQLTLSCGLDSSPAQRDALAATAGGAVHVRPFSANFLQWLQGSALSISCAGYNTCANLLSTGTPAIIVPNPCMSDQSVRAQLMAEHANANALQPTGLTPEALAEAILQKLANPLLEHRIALDGARRSRKLIEAICQT